jgi:hypothetical protein
MRQTITVLTLLIVLPAGLNAQSKRRDGNWWNGTTRDEKLDYIIGFFDGMDLGHNFTIWGVAGSQSDKGSPCLFNALKSYDDYSSKFFTNVTNYQLVDGLDTFYKDYRNRSIRVHDAVWVVVNTIAGTPQEKVDKLIENSRKAASTN